MSEQEKEMIKRLELAFKLVLKEDKELLMELGRR